MAVAQLRGVKFHQGKGGYWEPTYSGLEVPNIHKARKVLKDTHEWLGYEFVGVYLKAMVRLGSRIFNSATY